MSDDYIVESKSGASWHLPAIIVLGLIAIGGLAFGWNASSKLDTTQQAVTAQVNSMKQSVEQDMTSLKDRLVQDEKANADLQGDLKVVTDKLKITQGHLKKARMEALAANQDTTQKLTALDTSVHTELATKATSDDVKTVDTKVGGVRTDLDATRSDLNATREELANNSRNLGTLIARNSTELAELRKRGERDYVEFDIAMSKQFNQVGDVLVQLRKTDPKRQKYDVAINSDDKAILKKDRTANEPVTFLVGHEHMRYEFVVNSVDKDRIRGYLSIPKDRLTVSETPASLRLR